MKVTEKQAAFLIKFVNNDIVSDHGWEDTDASAWNADLCEDRSEAAVFGSLLRLGLMADNGESCWLTDAGRVVLRNLLGKM